MRSDSLRLNLWGFEKEANLLGFKKIAGVDEAGRGALAGPVVSAAVILPRIKDLFSDIDDSKKLSIKKRIYLYDVIYAHATAIGIGIVDAFEVDKTNILNASLISMKIAVQNLFPSSDYLLVDGISKIPLHKNILQKTIIRGDSLSVSIAAASIVAKVTRDRIMSQIDINFPEFGFAKHKGYATKIHRNKIQSLGYCVMHRMTFKGVKEFV